jgi:glucoamylase
VSETLDEWIAHQYAFSAAEMLRSISAANIIKTRPFFAQTIVPKKGSVVASPVLGSYDLDPDYFFHWYRDSAVVMEALGVLYSDGTIGLDAVDHFADFVRFSLSLLELDGSRRANEPEWRTHIAPGYERYVRTNEDLSAAKGADILGETRVNPDGTLDISRWPRPQNDGAASRALTVLRWLGTCSALDPELASDAARLLRGDLAFTLARWQQPCFDIWEEEEGHHYYTLRVQAAALQHGAE